MWHLQALSTSAWAPSKWVLLLLLLLLLGSAAASTPGCSRYVLHVGWQVGAILLGGLFIYDIFWVGGLLRFGLMSHAWAQTAQRGGSQWGTEGVGAAPWWGP